jgi:hypothetical protein
VGGQNPQFKVNFFGAVHEVPGHCSQWTWPQVSHNKVLWGSEADRKLDIFTNPADVVLTNGEHDWSHVLVIGEHKQNRNFILTTVASVTIRQSSQAQRLFMQRGISCLTT